MADKPSDHSKLRNFVFESNRIEGILGVRGRAMDAHAALLAMQELSVTTLLGFVAEIANADLRDRAGMDVRVGSHIPPPGGPEIHNHLGMLLTEVEDGALSPYEAHVRYETLHPFTDGNGRSGRAVWAWHMRRDGLDPFELPFLQLAYYQSLDHCRSSS